jgi:cytochrome c peroxidase
MDRLVSSVACFLLIASLPACGQDSASPAATTAPTEGEPPASGEASARSDKFNPRLLRRFKAVRSTIAGADGPPSEAQIALGRMLYFDRRLSRDRDLSCNSCHRLERYGVDNEPTSVGFHGQRGARNSPTVYHAAGHFVQFWDGRAPDVEEQAKGPIVNPVEMAMPDADHVVAVLASVPGYVEAFRAAFPGNPAPVSYDNLAAAIGAFERKLVTPSRWDRYVGGDDTALTAPEVEGLKLFTDVGCMVCHTGEFVGGAMFQKVGVVTPWPNQKDQGRFEVTKRAEDRMMFKVPSLRNVVKTGPYFHDGSAPTLAGAVEAMARHQLGIELTADEVASIVTFLGALTGELPMAYIAEPTLPPDGIDTAAVLARSHR